MSLTLILLLFNIAQAVNPKSQIDTRIVGGEIVTNREDFPYVVSIRLYNRNFCGEAIITSRHILTTSSCLHDSSNADLKPAHFKIVAGDLNLAKPTANTVVRQPIQLKHHESYSEGSFYGQYDIAVIKLDKEFKVFTSFIKKIEMPKKPPEAGKQCVVTGWGATKFPPDGTTPDELHMLPVISQSKCKEMYPDLLYAGMFCAGYVEGGKDTCIGDAGSSLVCDGVLYGLASWGVDCAVPNQTGVYTDVAYYRQWILEKGLKDNTDSLHHQRSGCILLFSVVVCSYVLQNVWFSIFVNI